jgi:hypothetical protein
VNTRRNVTRGTLVPMLIVGLIMRIYVLDDSAVLHLCETNDTMVQLLLARGANVNAVTKVGR